ncbi:MAG: VanZ family protein [Nitrospiria bacterium]
MKPYAVPLVWMILMFVFSTDIGSMQNTQSFFMPVLRFIFPEFSQTQRTSALLVIRKSAHLIEYGVLAALWLFVFSRGHGRRIPRPVLFALLISVGYAGLDELHHAFLASRSGSLVDVGIDTLGAVLGIVAVKGGALLSMSSAAKKKAKYFGWWFAWGGFSAIMVLIVIKGGSLVFWQMMLITIGVGVVAGTGGVLYYVRRG